MAAIAMAVNAEQSIAGRSAVVDVDQFLLVGNPSSDTSNCPSSCPGTFRPTPLGSPGAEENCEAVFPEFVTQELAQFGVSGWKPDLHKRGLGKSFQHVRACAYFSVNPRHNQQLVGIDWNTIDQVGRWVEGRPEAKSSWACSVRLQTCPPDVRDLGALAMWHEVGTISSP